MSLNHEGFGIIVSEIAEKLARGLTVLVHCIDGQDRTGIVAMTLVNIFKDDFGFTEKNSCSPMLGQQELVTGLEGMESWGHHLTITELQIPSQNILAHYYPDSQLQSISVMHL